MNDTQTLVLIHAVAWPILIWLLSKTWSYAWLPCEPQIDDESRPVVPETQSVFHPRDNEWFFRPYDRATVGVLMAVGAAVCMPIVVAVDVADAVAVAVQRGIAVAVAITVTVAVALASSGLSGSEFTMNRRA